MTEFKKHIIRFILCVIIPFTILIYFARIEPVHPEELSASGKIINGTLHPTLLSQQSLKLITVIIPCMTSGISGWIEADRFGAKTPLPPNTYHTFKFIRDAGYLYTGYIYYTNIKNPYLSTREKICRISGSLLLQERAFENVYMWARHGDDRNRKEFNQKNFIYIEFYHWIPRDAYISFGNHGREWNVGLIGMGLILYCLGG